MKINIVCKSYIMDFLKTFLILLFSMSFLLAIVAVVEKIDDFMQYKPSAVFFIQYTIYSIPRYIFYLIPFVTLICSLFIFSIGVRNREFLILSVSGGRLREILKPFIFLGILISTSGFIFGEFIQPEFTKKINTMIEELTEKGKSSVQKELYLRTRDGIVVKFGRFSQGEKTGSDVKIFIIKNEMLLKRLDCEEVEIKDKEWILKNVVIYDFVSGSVDKAQELTQPINLKISLTVFKDIKKIEELGIAELMQKKKELKRVGLSNPKIDTDIGGRLSYNFVTFFMIVLGISLPLGAYEKFSFLFFKTKSTGGGGIITAGIGLLITIIYWLLYSFFMFMGYSRILPPFIAPWITPLIFGAVSIKLYYSIRE